MFYEVPIEAKMPIESSIAGLWATRRTINIYAIEKRAAQNRNYTINIDDSDGTQIITLNTVGQSFTINDLLPNGISVQRNHLFTYYDDAQKKIWYALDSNKSGFVLGLLHEVRHAQIAPPIYDMPEEMDYTEALIYFKPIAVKIKNGDFSSEIDQKDAYDRILYISRAYKSFDWQYLYKKIVGEKLPLAFLEATFAYMALEEIECWRYAVEQAKYLEGLGFNVLGDFRSEEEMQRYIESCLATYERGRYQTLQRRGAIGEIYHPIFL